MSADLRRHRDQNLCQDLSAKVDQLTRRLEHSSQKHQETLAALQEEARELRKKLQDHGGAPTQERTGKDDSFMRKVEWRIANLSDAAAAVPKKEAMWSDQFTIMGVPMQLEFFPHGRESTYMDGFCALFLWCPAGVKIRYQLRVGTHRTAPDADEYVVWMGHGHSNFCYLDAQRDTAADSVVVGVDILALTICQDMAEGLRIVNEGPEACLRREAAMATQRGLEKVEWRIKEARRRAAEVPRGSALCSTPFSLAGVREVLLEFYPNGIRSGGMTSSAVDPKAGFCGFYVRCPAGNRLVLTLFVGSVVKGPIETEFDGQGAKGLPEFCRLDEQLVEGKEDLVVGVVVHNPKLQKEEQKTELTLG